MSERRCAKCTMLTCWLHYPTSNSNLGFDILVGDYVELYAYTQYTYAHTQKE